MTRREAGKEAKMEGERGVVLHVLLLVICHRHRQSGDWVCLVSLGFSFFHWHRPIYSYASGARVDSRCSLSVQAWADSGARGADAVDSVFVAQPNGKSEPWRHFKGSSDKHAKKQKQPQALRENPKVNPSFCTKLCPKIVWTKHHNHCEKPEAWIWMRLKTEGEIWIADKSCSSCPSFCIN